MVAFQSIPAGHWRWPERWPKLDGPQGQQRQKTRRGKDDAGEISDGKPLPPRWQGQCEYACVQWRPGNDKRPAELLLQALPIMVGAAGFELATLCSQSRCATRLRYAPTARILTREISGSGQMRAFFEFFAATAPDQGSIGSAVMHPGRCKLRRWGETQSITQPTTNGKTQRRTSSHQRTATGVAAWRQAINGSTDLDRGRPSGGR